MQYKTIVLEMLQQRPQLYDRLLTNRMLMAAMDHYASELKTLHGAWKEVLLQEHPESAPGLIASEALELALQAIQDFLPPEPADESDSLSLDGAMAFLRRQTSAA